jgi:hypothetical protein
MCPNLKIGQQFEWPGNACASIVDDNVYAAGKSRGSGDRCLDLRFIRNISCK